MLRLVAFAAALLVTWAASAQTPVPANSRMKTIVGSKVIKIGYRNDARPFSFVKEGNEPSGFSIDLCKMAVSVIEQQYKIDHLRIEWVPVTLQTRFSAVASGKADMECGASTVTLGRMAEVDFSNFIFVESTGLTVTKASNIRSFADLTGKKIAVIAGTTNERAIIDQFKRQKLEATLISVKDRDDGIGMVESGAADAYASDKLLLVGANMKKPEALIMLPDDLSVVELYNMWFERVGLRFGPVMTLVYGLGALPE
jgi:ABC-type amino acid transport substrate-binding protein